MLSVSLEISQFARAYGARIKYNTFQGKVSVNCSENFARTSGARMKLNGVYGDFRHKLFLQIWLWHQMTQSLWGKIDENWGNLARIAQKNLLAPAALASTKLDFMRKSYTNCFKQFGRGIRGHKI